MHWWRKLIRRKGHEIFESLGAVFVHKTQDAKDIALITSILRYVPHMWLKPNYLVGKQKSLTSSFDVKTPNPTDKATSSIIDKLK